ncbi:MAG: ribosome silencing factor [Clostridiales bacterium]|nr:ribosome silencing factor [Clostridiales bacterium]
MNLRTLKQKIIEVLEDKKARGIVAIDVEKVTILADSFIICSGTSTTHIRALADEVEKALNLEFGIVFNHREGYGSARWVLLDYGDIVVHIFHEEDRKFYDIERLWADGIVTYDGVRANFN